MKISVIIPTFNRAHVIQRAVDSVMQQTMSAFELIVVDDGSQDGTIERLEGYDGTRVKVTYQENRGVSAARNTGIREACGDWIAFLDSDDVWHKTKLEEQRKALEAHPDYRICHTDEIWIRKGVRVNPMKKHRKPNGWIFDQCLPLCCVSPSSVLLHRGVLDRIGVFDPHLPACEDYDLWLRIFSVYPVLLVDQPLLTKYGGHDDQLSRRYWGMDRFRAHALIKLLESGSLDNGQAQNARTMLLKKLTILMNGAKKRGKFDDHETWRLLYEHWEPIS